MMPPRPGFEPGFRAFLAQKLERPAYLTRLYYRGVDTD